MCMVDVVSVGLEGRVGFALGLTSARVRRGKLARQERPPPPTHAPKAPISRAATHQQLHFRVARDLLPCASTRREPRRAPAARHWLLREKRV